MHTAQVDGTETADLNEMLDYAFALTNDEQIINYKSKTIEYLSTLNANNGTQQSIDQIFESVSNRDFKIKLAEFLNCEEDESSMNALSEIYQYMQQYQRYQTLLQKVNDYQDDQVECFTSSMFMTII